MQIKRFEAKNMAEAFKSIKQEFGPDAVILSAKTIQKEKGLFNTPRASLVEVLAANDTYVLGQEAVANKRKAIESYTPARTSVVKEETKPKNNVFQNIGSRLNPLKPLKVTESRSMDQQDEINEDLAEMNNLKNHLLVQGIETEFVAEIIDRVRRIESSNKRKINKDVNTLLYHALEEMGIESAAETEDEQRQKKICFLGLTGVGKTTTLVKLAAIEMIEKQRSVGFISLDSFRVGSNALLNVYANILGFTVYCASNVKEIKTALKELKDRDVILIDTPGIGLNDHYQKYQIKELIDKLDPHQIHLLMHANLKKTDAQVISRNFELFDYNRILFTKIDETKTYGTIVNQIIETEKPISYITQGQNIPEDITQIDLKSLVDLLMKNQNKNDFENSKPASFSRVGAKNMAAGNQFKRLSYI